MKKTISILLLFLFFLLTSCSLPIKGINSSLRTPPLKSNSTFPPPMQTTVPEQTKKAFVTIPPSETPTTTPTSTPSKTPAKTASKTPSKTHIPSPTSTPVLTPTPASTATSGLDQTEVSWSYPANDKGLQPIVSQTILSLFKKESAWYIGSNASKTLYLTFDEGYENGYTSKILDTLKNAGVSAAFFVTTSYVKANPMLIKRMVQEGHLVGNHSTTHPSMAQIATQGKAAFLQELIGVENAYQQVTGSPLAKFFRPPMGKYSSQSLAFTRELGYKTIFWSFAYADWDPSKQPDPVYARDYIFRSTHNGAIILLHAVSKTDTELLGGLLQEWKSKGYQFSTLTNL